MTEAQKYCHDTNQVYYFENGQISYPKEVIKAFEAGRSTGPLMPAEIEELKALLERAFRMLGKDT